MLLVLQVQYAYELLTNNLLKRDYDTFYIDEYIVWFCSVVCPIIGSLFCINIFVYFEDCNFSIFAKAILHKY